MPESAGYLYRVSQQGEMLGSSVVDHPLGMTFLTHVYWNATHSTLQIIGMVADSANIDAPDWMHCLIAEVDGSTIQLTTFGPPVNYCASGSGFIDSDGSLVTGHYDYQDFDTGAFHFRATRICANGVICETNLVHEQMGIGRFHAMSNIPNHGIIAILPSIHANCSPSNDGIVSLSNDLDTLGCAPIMPVDTGIFNTLSTFNDNVSLIPLVSGDMLICGMYQRIMQPEWWNPIAIQRLRPTGELLSYRRFYNSSNPAIMMRPGIMRGMSSFDASTFAFAYSDFAWTGGPLPAGSETSDIHVLRMDTALNILGEHVFHGDGMNRYHFLSSVVASPDGAVYVMGSVYDHDDTVPRPKAWIARVAPEQFVAVPEASQAGLSVHPNPGSVGFTLGALNPFSGGQVQVFDLHGRMMLEKSVSSLPAWVDGARLPAGMYLVRVVARDGSAWTQRWAKE